MSTQTQRLTDRITLQRPVTTLDGLGQPVETWRTVTETWADVRALSTRQWLAAAQVQTNITHQIVIRHRAGIAPTWRALWRGERLHIVGEPVPMGARKWLRINAESRARDETDDIPAGELPAIPAGALAIDAGVIGIDAGMLLIGI